MAFLLLLAANLPLGETWRGLWQTLVPTAIIDIKIQETTKIALITIKNGKKMTKTC